MSCFSSVWQSEHFSFLGVNNQANLSDMRCRTTFYTALGRLLMVDLGKGVPKDIAYKHHVKRHISLETFCVFDRWGWGPVWTVHASSHCCVRGYRSDVQHQHLQWTRSKSETYFLSDYLSVAWINCKRPCVFLFDADLQVHLNKLECRGKVHLFQ